MGDILFLFIMPAQGSNCASLTFASISCKKDSPLKRALQVVLFPLPLTWGNLLTILLEQTPHSDSIFKQKLHEIFVNLG